MYATATATGKAALTPLSSLHVSRYQIPKHGGIPNTSVQRKPLLIYHSAFPPSITASQIEDHIESVGVCVPEWRYTMYRTSHFHSTTHEFLVVFKGSAKLLFGGEGNPERVEVDVKKGDAILIPAGVSHRLLREGWAGYEMVGSYPVGAAPWDMCYGKPGENTALIEQRISRLGWFDRDPLYGAGGPAASV